MTDDADRRRTTTSHQIDLGQLYGGSAAVTDALRLHSEAIGRKGRLKSEITSTGEWAPRLYDAAGQKPVEFAALPDPIHLPPGWPPGKLATIFAFGGERANSTAYTASINTLFLREHNRLCGVLEAANPSWDDERVFQTARNIGIIQLIKIVVEEYINHISPYWFKLLADPTACYKAIWNRENWIPAEFNLLYRWHSLIPETSVWNDTTIAIADICFDNGGPLRDGLAAALDSASRSKAWQIGLFNTSSMLAAVELASIAQGRTNQLASYNDYRAIMKYPRVTRFEQISSDPGIVARLREVYQHVDNIEFFAGLFAEDVPDRSAVPRLIGRMVAADAFSHALTNPLLSPHVYNETTFTAAGMVSIAATSRLRDLAIRNDPGGSIGLVSMEQEGYNAFAAPGGGVGPIRQSQSQ
jgi:prostaglandin-endoperoxide synthase 2